MTEKELNQAEEANLKIYKALLPKMASHNNPKWTKAVKGTPLEHATPTQIESISTTMKKIYSNRWAAFKDAWTNVFGGRDIQMLNKSPQFYLNEYMKTVLRDGRDSFRKGHADNFLKRSFLKEKIYNKER